MGIVKTKEAWTKAKSHNVVLPSGTEVEIVIPNLPALIKSGKVPNALLDLVTNAGEDTRITPEAIGEQSDFYNYLVSITVKQPEILPEDVPDLPYEDVECIAAFALRQRDMDAAYRHIGGLEKIDSFRRARKLTDRDPAVADL